MGLKKNIVYNTILTTSNYIFPLIVYPYVARVLGVTNIGLCNFIDGIINYFILFSMMGITIMGNRQIATDKTKNISLDSTFSSLFTLNGITTAIAIALLYILIYTLPDFEENKEMLIFGSIKIISNFFLIEWLYKGLEDFKYITVRTILVKCLYVVAVFLLVRKETDYKMYYLLTVLMVTGNSIINMVHSRSYVKFRLKLISFKPIIKSFFILGAYMLITSFCNTFNTVFLGFMTNDTQVGYFTTATKLYSIFMALFTGVTVVMLPRMSSLVAAEKSEEFRQMLQKTTRILFSFAIPVIIVTTMFSPQIIYLISGPGYEGAINPMRVVMFLMLIIGYEQIAVIQCLMPLNKDKLIMINASCGALVSIVLNIILVSKIGSLGSAISLLSAELTILILSQIAMTKILKVPFPFKEFFKNIIYNLPLLGILLAIYLTVDLVYWFELIIAGLIAVIYFIAIQILVIKDPIVMSIVGKIKKI